MEIIKPQQGFQSDFLSSPADIVIGGGAAGAGKSFALLLEPLRHIHHPDFSAVAFRRTYPEITNPGGLWETAGKLYPSLQGKPTDMDWKFPWGSQVVFRHLQRESDIYSWQGTQVPLLLFDELTHFTARQFWYMLSRNRNPHNNRIRPYVRATCNPDPDSFVAELIDWYIDNEEKLPNGDANPRYGFPIPERCGKLRYFTRDGDNLVWGNTEREVIDKAPHLFTGALAGIKPKSLTFIPGDIYGNQALLKSDPGYLANLMAQSEEEKSRLLHGNWKIRTDNLSLMTFGKIGDIFTNYPANTTTKCITCDAARFGRDFTVIMVWEGWQVVAIKVLTKSDANDIVKAIEESRQDHGIGKSMVLIDQDGVGDGAVSLGSYKGFHGGTTALPEPESRDSKRENYENFKTQCWYRIANRINNAEIKVLVSNETVQVDGVRSSKIKVGSKVVDIRDLIKEDLRAIKKKDPDGDGKKKINSKEEQKILLKGRSPDFGDTIMMREYFELDSPIKKYKARTYG